MLPSRDALFKKEQKKKANVCDNSHSQAKKKRARHNFQFQMELSFDTQDAKQAFVARIERAKFSLASSGSLPLDSKELISALLDNLEQISVGPIPDTERRVVIQSTDRSKVFPMLENSGLCIKS